MDVGGTKTAVVISAKPPEILGRVQFPTAPARGPAYALGRIERAIGSLLAKQRLNDSAIGCIGVSCGGPLDRVHGIIQSPPNLPTWVDVPIKRLLEERFGVRCRLENDANAGAVAEHRYGAGRGARNMVFLTMGTGFGAGVIIDRRLYRGTNDLAGEIGHLRLTRGGPVGHNKAGSVEGWVSGGGMVQVARRAVADAQRRRIGTTLAKHPGRILTARDVGLAAGRGDAVAMRIVNSTGGRLGRVLAMLVDILNPDRIIVGGMALKLGDMILEPARRVMRTEALEAATRCCQVVPAALGARIGDVAALCVAMGL
ncbi:MAG: ROK family protein [Candidatus Binataceae bacterium]